MGNAISFARRAMRFRPAAAAAKWAQSPLAWSLLGFLLGRAATFGEMWPFGLAFAAALRATNRRRRAVWPFLGVAFGLISAVGIRFALPYYAVLAALWLAGEKPFAETRWVWRLAIGCLILKMPLHYLLHPVPMVLVAGVAECVLAVVSFRLLYFAVAQLSQRKLAFVEVFWLLSLLVMAISLNWRTGGFSLRIFLFFYLIVIGAKVGGLGVSCILGPALAFLGLMLGESAATTLLIVVGSLLIGVLRKFRWGPYVGAALAVLFSVNGSATPASIQLLLAIWGAVWLARWVSPLRLKHLARIIPGTQPFHDREKGYGRHLRRVLDQRIGQYLTVFEELENTMAGVDDPIIGRQLEGMTEFLQTMKNAFAADVQFMKHFEEKMLNRFATEDLDYITVIKTLDGFDVFGALKEPCGGRRFCQKVADFCSGTIESQRYSVVSCNCLQDVKCGFRIAPCPNYKLEIGRAKVAQEEISGDSQVTFEIAGSKVGILLSDGMGVGLRAHTESSVAVRLLERMIKAGYDLSMAVSLINRLLLLRNQDEMFVTIDLVVVDLFSGQLEFVKIGSAPSFIKRGREVEIIHNHALPVGVLSQVDVETARKALKEGELLIMATDGVLDVQRNIVRKDEWMSWNLKRLRNSGDMAALAEEILAESIEIAGGKIQDDMMVVVARLVKKDWEIDAYRRSKFSRERFNA